MTITIADGRGALWQWDTGRRVRVDDSSVKQVHYQNKCFGRSVDVDVGDDGTAIIPDELLQDWHPLTAYAYVTDDAGGYTKVQVDFVVHKRARPSDYVYTPTEHAGFDRLRAEIGDLDDLKTTDKSCLVAAVNEALKSGGADWSQNDPDGDGYVKNRPGAYTLKNQEAELCSIDITADGYMTGEVEGAFTYILYNEAAPVMLDYAVGDTAVFEYGGKRYTSTVAAFPGQEETLTFGATVTVGDDDLGIDWADCPVCVLVMQAEDGQRVLYAMYAQSALATKFRILRIGDVDVKIPEKYLDLDNLRATAASILKLDVHMDDGGNQFGVYDDAANIQYTSKSIVAAYNAGAIIELRGNREVFDHNVIYDGETGNVAYKYSYKNDVTTYTDCAIFRAGQDFLAVENDGELIISQESYLYLRAPYTDKEPIANGKKRELFVDDSGGIAVREADGTHTGKILSYLPPYSSTWTGDEYYTLCIDINTGKPRYVKLSNYLGLTGAAVGQIARIAAVDSDGKPTAWEAVDMPAGAPAVTATDNGKFLRVVNGAWAAAAISNANGVSF